MKVAVLTTSRADYGLQYQLIDRIEKDKDLESCLIVSGSHLAPEFGLTIKHIKHPFAERVEVLLNSDTPTAACKSFGVACIGYSAVLERQKPDWLILLGDRFETAAMAVCAHILNVPIAHISGGEVTTGAIDDAFRHCITKLSYLHFTYSNKYRQRVIQLGESPERVFNVGFLGLDEIYRYVQPGKRKGYLIVFHPETLQKKIWVNSQIDTLLGHLAFVPDPLYFCLSNSGDPNSRSYNIRIKSFVKSHPDRSKILNLSRREFLRKLATVKAIVGNSSAGIYEAPALGTPTINIGDRQFGREFGPSIISCECTPESITEAFEEIKRPEYNKHLKKIWLSVKPSISEKIISHIKNCSSVNLKKGFFDA